MIGKQECSRLPVEILNGILLILIFYRAIPDKTLTLKGHQCNGGKMAKQRLTIVVSANLCEEKEQPLVIYIVVCPIPTFHFSVCLGMLTGKLG